MDRGNIIIKFHTYSVNNLCNCLVLSRSLINQQDHHPEAEPGPALGGQGQPDAEHEGEGEREEGLAALHQAGGGHLHPEGRLQGDPEDQ